METLALIIPVYNESEALPKLIETWTQVLENLKIDYKIHFFDDGSKDKSLEYLNQISSINSRIITNSHENMGHGRTILRGYYDCCQEYTWMFQIDSDNEISASEFSKLWNLRSDFDFVLGQRQSRQSPLFRKIISFVSTRAISFLFGVKISDANCPFRLIKSSAFSSVPQELALAKNTPNLILSGFMFREFSSKEVPVEFCFRKTGEVTLRKFKLLKFSAQAFFQIVKATKFMRLKTFQKKVIS